MHWAERMKILLRPMAYGIFSVMLTKNCKMESYTQSGRIVVIFFRILIEDEAKNVCEMLQLEFEGSDKVKSAKVGDFEKGV